MTISVFYEHVVEAAEQENIGIPKVLYRIRQAGITGVELDRERLSYDVRAEKYIKEAGMSVHGLYRFFDFGYRYGEDDKKEAEALVDDAVRLKAQVLVIPGFVHEEDMDDAARREHKLHCDNPRTLPVVERMADAVGEIVEYAKEKGVVVSMEDFDDCRSPIATGEGLLWFLKRVKGLTAAFDIGNFLYSEEEAQEALVKLLPYVKQVHLKDRALRENDGECRRTVSGRKMYPAAVGSGCIAVERIVRRLQDSGYDGNYAIEHFGSKHQLADMLASVRYVRSLM